MRDNVEFNHVSVLYKETLDGLNIKPDGIYVDGTLGGAGHSSGICERLNEDGVLIGIDQDSDAIDVAKKRLEKFNNKIFIVKNNYLNIESILKELSFGKVDGIMLDIGVSSYQIDTKERGFSYMKDAPLDMRMDKESGFTAKNIINEYSVEELINIFKVYGEEKYSKRIANEIIERRKVSDINTTLELSNLIKEVVPYSKKGSHPAKKVFQALRIEVNRELEVLEKSIEKMVELLNTGGRLCIITFHSLEDRIVKNVFRKLQDPCICPKDFPVCMCGKKPVGKIITRKPIIPTDEERNINSRANSAKLRIIEKI